MTRGYAVFAMGSVCRYTVSGGAVVAWADEGA